MAHLIRAPRGTQVTCKNWLIEAAYRMLQNNLDPQVAGDPEHLIVYGGRAKPLAIGLALTRFCKRCAAWSRTRRCWSNRASR